MNEVTNRVTTLIQKWSERERSLQGWVCHLLPFDHHASSCSLSDHIGAHTLLLQEIPSNGQAVYQLSLSAAWWAEHAGTEDAQTRIKAMTSSMRPWKWTGNLWVYAEHLLPCVGQIQYFGSLWCFYCHCIERVLCGMWPVPNRAVFRQSGCFAMYLSNCLLYLIRPPW